MKSLIHQVMSTERHNGTVTTMTTLQAGHPRNHTSILEKGKEISLFPSASRPALGPKQPPAIKWVPKNLSSPKVKTEWIYTSTPHMPSWQAQDTQTFPLWEVGIIINKSRLKNEILCLISSVTYPFSRNINIKFKRHFLVACPNSASVLSDWVTSKKRSNWD